MIPIILDKFYKRCESEENFLVKLRMGEGLDHKALNDEIAEIQALASHFEGAAMIPKRLTSYLFEIPYALPGAIAFYDQAQQAAIHAAVEPLFQAILHLLNDREVD